MRHDIMKDSDMRAYIDSLEAAGEKHTGSAWRRIIEAEAKDLGCEIDIDYAIGLLEEDGYIENNEEDLA